MRIPFAHARQKGNPMIKLIISDIDGTLLQGAALEIDPAVFTQIERLRQKGIYFCPASGRQYASLRKLFAPIADDICYICENGSIVYGVGDPGAVLRKSVLPTALVQELCADIMALDGVEIVISGANTSYLCPKEKDLSRRLETFLGNRVAVLASPADVPEDIIKVCLFSHEGITPAVLAIRERWADTFDAVVSGKQWIDFTRSDKAQGVQQICAHYGTNPAQVLAVGDNYNDVGMLQLVGYPYLMENAAPALKEQLNVPSCAKVSDLLASIAP